MSAMGSIQPVSCQEMLGEMTGRHEILGAPRDAEIFQFADLGDRDVYNLTAPFEIDGRTIIAARIEPRDSMVSDIGFFYKVAAARGRSTWKTVPGSPRFEQMQDPCIAWIGGELVFGGVRYPLGEVRERGGWQMRFYKGKSLSALQPFLDGPRDMKDIRFVELRDGRVGVFSRPHEGLGPDGEPVRNGTIGFDVADSLSDVTMEMIAAAPLLRDQVPAGTEKVGANEAHLLADGRLGVLAHAAYDDPDGQHYFSTSFILDPASREFTPMKMIGSRRIFPRGPSKRDTLRNVVFSGGLIRQPNHRATLYCGLSDCECGQIEIDDPFERVCD